MNNYILVVFDSCRYDSFVRARPKNIRKLGPLGRRYSYASWTAPSHFNLLTGLLPHPSPKHVFASEWYRKDFLAFRQRLGVADLQFKSLVPRLYLPHYLQQLGYRTHARVSMPVLNPRTILNAGFDTYQLMDRHNDFRAMLGTLQFDDARPSFHLLNAGETHYPYALPDEPQDAWPRINGVHGVFKHLDEELVGGKLKRRSDRFFDPVEMDRMHRRQIAAVRHLDKVMEELFDLAPPNTFITVTSDHGELFGEDGYFGHGPVMHERVFEVPLVEGQLR